MHVLPCPSKPCRVSAESSLARGLTTLLGHGGREWKGEPHRKDRMWPACNTHTKRAGRHYAVCCLSLLQRRLRLRKHRPARLPLRLTSRSHGCERRQHAAKTRRFVLHKAPANKDVVDASAAVSSYPAKLHSFAGSAADVCRRSVGPQREALIRVGSCQQLTTSILQKGRGNAGRFLLLGGSCRALRRAVERFRESSRVPRLVDSLGRLAPWPHFHCGVARSPRTHHK